MMVWSSPEFLLGLLALAPFWGWVWFKRQHMFTARERLRLPTLHLLDSHLTSAFPLKLWISIILRGLAATLLILAATDLSLLGRQMPGGQQGRPVMLLVDSSLTMTLEDLDPSARVTRMEATQAFLREWIEARPQNAFGLITFGSSAAVMLEPTTDQTLVRSELSRIQIGTLGDNTALGDALGLALQALARVPNAQQQPAVVVVSDGEQSNSGSLSPLEAVAAARKQGIAIHGIQFGSPAGRPIDQPSLDEISALTGGQYWQVSRATDLKQVLSDLDGLTPLMDLPPQRAPSVWLSPWLVFASGLIAALSFLLQRNRTRDLIDPKLRAWSLVRSDGRPRWRHGVTVGLWIAAGLLGLVLVYLMEHELPQQSDLGSRPVVAVLDLFEPSAAKRQAHRLALLQFAKDNPEAGIAVVVAANSPGLALPLAQDRRALERMLSQLTTHREALVERVMGEGMDPTQGRKLAIARAQRYASLLGDGLVLEVNTEMLANALADQPGRRDSEANEQRADSWQWVACGLALLVLLASVPTSLGSLVIGLVLTSLIMSGGLQAAELTKPMPRPLQASDRVPVEQAFDQGLARLASQSHASAVVSFERVLTLASPAFSQAALFNLALAWSHQQRWDVAQAAWENYLRHNPQDTAAQQNLNYVLGRRAAARAAAGAQTDLRGRRGTAAMGQVQIDGYGATEAELNREDPVTQPQAQSASARLPDRAVTAQPSSARPLEAARRWVISEDAARNATVKLDRLPEDTATLLKGLLSQREQAETRP
jgi:Ca-activated chloride channel family protein